MNSQSSISGITSGPWGKAKKGLYKPLPTVKALGRNILCRLYRRSGWKEIPAQVGTLFRLLWCHYQASERVFPALWLWHFYEFRHRRVPWRFYHLSWKLRFAAQYDCRLHSENAINDQKGFAIQLCGRRNLWCDKHAYGTYVCSLPVNERNHPDLLL